MAVRLSYSLICVAPGWGQPQGETLKIHIEYGSGRSQTRSERFKSAAEARQFVERFYPDLVGKCTEIEKLNDRKPAKSAAAVQAPSPIRTRRSV